MPRRIYYLNFWIKKVLTSDGLQDLSVKDIKGSPSRFSLRDRVVLDPLAARVLEEVLAGVGGQVHALDDPGGWNSVTRFKSGPI